MVYETTDQCTFLNCNLSPSESEGIEKFRRKLDGIKDLSIRGSLITAGDINVKMDLNLDYTDSREKNLDMWS